MKLGAMASTAELSPEMLEDSGFDLWDYLMKRALSRLKVVAHDRGLVIRFDSVEITHATAFFMDHDAVLIEGIAESPGEGIA